MNKLNKRDECYQCINKRSVPGDVHIKCIDPDLKMTGAERGKLKGWFIYPSCFDPVWKTKACDNFKQKGR